MNRNLQGWLACALLVTSFGAGSAAAQGSQDQTGGAPGEWLSRYTNARSLGFGSANVALADDPLGVMWNPAGLSFMNQNQVRFENAQLFGESTLNSVGFAVPGSRWPSLGVAMVSLSSGDFERTNDVNDPLGSLQNEAGDQLQIKSCSWFSTYRIHHRAAVHFRDRRCFLREQRPFPVFGVVEA